MFLIVNLIEVLQAIAHSWNQIRLIEVLYLFLDLIPKVIRVALTLSWKRDPKIRVFKVNLDQTGSELVQYALNLNFVLVH